MQELCRKILVNAMGPLHEHKIRDKDNKSKQVGKLLHSNNNVNKFKSNRLITMISVYD